MSCIKGPAIEAIDLFCGVGGLTHGLQRSGIEVKLGVDIDQECAYPYKKNNSSEFLLKSVEEVTLKELNVFQSKKSVKLLAGCAPCQTFSKYNQKASVKDNRWWLLRQFSRIINELKPELVTMENVPLLISKSVFREFVENLEAGGYFVNYKIVNCADFGISQRRKRLVLLASKFGLPKLLNPEELGVEHTNVSDAIGDLPKIEAGEKNVSDPLHQSASLNKKNLCRMLASKPGGSWRDWSNELRLDCHKKKAGKSYSSVYGRMRWDAPSPTITTQFYGYGNGRFGHPEQNRAISLREGALLQSFPRNYVFYEPGKKIYSTSIGRLIGNAVPVKLGEVIGLSLLKHLSNNRPKPMSDLS